MNELSEGCVEIAPGLFEDRRTCGQIGGHGWVNVSMLMSCEPTTYALRCRRCCKYLQPLPLSPDS